MAHGCLNLVNERLGKMLTAYLHALLYNTLNPRCQVCAKISPEGEG